MDHERKKFMKKTITLLLLATVLLLSGCFWAKKPQAVSQENAQGSETTQSPAPSAQTSEKPAEKSAAKAAEKPAAGNEKKDGMTKGEGAFLGMDDNNSLVIIEKSGDKVGEQRYKISDKLKFEDSNIEIGQAVQFYYKTEKDGVKVIQEITKK